MPLFSDHRDIPSAARTLSAMTLLQVLLGSLLFLNLLSLPAAYLALQAHRRAFGQRYPPPDVWPGVSVIKPLRGLDPHAERALRTTLAQDYPGPVEFIFAVEEAGDPAAAMVRRLIAEHPSVQARFLIGPPHPRRTGKVNNLMTGLEGARHDILIFSDSDVEAPPTFLQHLVGPLLAPGVGLAFALPQYVGPRSAPALLHALLANTSALMDFAPMALAGLGVAAGAALAVRREVLEQVGGLGAVADSIAEDVRLAQLVRGADLRIVMSDQFALVQAGALTWGEVIRLLRRWALAARAMTPGIYALLPLRFAYIQAAALWLLGSKTGLASLGLIVMGRIWVAWAACGLTPQARPLRRWAWIMPLLDVVTTIGWAMPLRAEIGWRGSGTASAPEGDSGAPPDGGPFCPYRAYITGGAVTGL
jgi:ceramide glucosyltransferase